MEHTGKMIELRNIVKTFPITDSKEELKVLDDISIDIDKNEFVVVLGPGQCGKTTLINIIAGLEERTGGEVIVDGNMITQPNPDIGVVYQKTALFPWFTVRGNVGFGPMVRGVDKKEKAETVQHYIDLVGLTGFEKSFPIKLSGGMRQRVGIARAYANDPKVLLMDEPFGHLDAQTRYLMQEEVERIWQADKKTILFVTNNVEEAVYLADRIIVLSNCPTHIIDEFRIDIPRPRNYVSEEFLSMRKKVSGVFERTK